MYDADKQYRCTIIRGKSQRDIDDLLPAYALVVDQVCPCNFHDFAKEFNEKFQEYLPADERNTKKLSNHRTEICGKLFGMYYVAEDGIVYESERTLKYLEDNDQPAFFKDICFKAQFPNGSQKISTVIERINDKICVRPNAFVLKVLLDAKKLGMVLTKKEIGYYILNSLDVLQGNATPVEVLQAIVKDRTNGNVKEVEVPGKASSYSHQHLNEQINYLELANLLYVDNDGVDSYVSINPNEIKTIEFFASYWDKKPEFDVYSYKLDTIEARKVFQFAWDEYFGKLSSPANEFSTPVSALVNLEGEDDDETGETGEGQTGLGNLEIGEEGERVVFEYEKARVAAFNRRLVNKVLYRAETKGLGYDIQSVVAENGPEAEFVKYIEVKTTKKTYLPNINDPLWIDTINITRNEWVAAQQHQNFYAIYRVYFTREGISIFVLNNPKQKEKDGTLTVVPMTYRVDFSNTAVDDVLLPGKKGEAD